MRADPPAQGPIAEARHLFAVRVYFEDTDLSGVVYHANYLRFMERARSDLLRQLGIDQRAAFETGVGVYAVADLSLRFLAPARLDDDLLVETQAFELKAATVLLAQSIRRAATPIVEARVRLAFLSPAGRPQRQPADWLARYRALLAPNAVVAPGRP